MLNKLKVLKNQNEYKTYTQQLMLLKKECNKLWKKEYKGTLVKFNTPKYMEENVVFIYFEVNTKFYDRKYNEKVDQKFYEFEKIWKQYTEYVSQFFGENVSVVVSSLY